MCKRRPVHMLPVSDALFFVLNNSFVLYRCSLSCAIILPPSLPLSSFGQFNQGARRPLASRAFSSRLCSLSGEKYSFSGFLLLFCFPLIVLSGFSFPSSLSFTHQVSIMPPHILSPYTVDYFLSLSSTITVQPKGALCNQIFI